MSLRLHATTVALRTQKGWIGVLLTGPSGSGKSDLALRLMSEGWRLVADDYTEVWSSAGALWASAPDILPGSLHGHIEARGLGIISARAVRHMVGVGLVVACCQRPAERMPEPDFVDLEGQALPRLELDVRPASATVTLLEAVRHLASSATPAKI